MKDWQRSPEPPGMMGPQDDGLYDSVQGNWGQPEELLDGSSDPAAYDLDASADFDPAAPLPGHAPPSLLLARAGPGGAAAMARRLASTSTPALSLYTMCQRVIMRNLHSVQDLGDMPYRNAKPILEACRVDQLVVLEEASPHFLADTEEIWRRNCIRDFIELRKKYNSGDRREPKSWRRLYLRTRGEIEQAKVEAAQRIRDKYSQHKAEKEAKRLVVSDRPIITKGRSSSSGFRRFGSGPAGVSKGQSLLNKARSGSVAAAKLTAPRGNAYRAMGKSQAVGAELAPQQQRLVRPMVAPKRISAAPTEGLARLREFAKPTDDSGQSDESPYLPSSKSSGRGANENTDAATSSIQVPPKRANTSSTMPESAQASTRSANGTRVSSPPPPPPDLSRIERHKLDFFGRKSSGSNSAVPTRSVSSKRDRQNQSGPADILGESRGQKRALSSCANGAQSPLVTTSGVTMTKTKMARHSTSGASHAARTEAASASGSNGASKSQAIVIDDDGDQPDELRIRLPAQSQSTPSPTKRSAASPAATRYARPSPSTSSPHVQASAASLSSIFMPSSRQGKGRVSSSSPHQSPSARPASAYPFPKQGQRPDASQGRPY
ncbi:hypothetical protein BCV70DRAFT_201520 [Testicularia cyperi]|uniref:Elongin-A n=1 Tax=Testicularia cyperi TaxID=1882483 RepID=A0A317XLL7_9BASI|nr:hypothetical protein BCV70DRAFT_201520 [Testicularia cyperi]